MDGVSPTRASGKRAATAALRPVELTCWVAFERTAQLANYASIQTPGQLTALAELVRAELLSHR